MPDVNIRSKPCDTTKLKQSYEHLRNIGFEHLNPGVVSVLIGASSPHIVLHRDFISGKPEEPYAVKTLLGWVIMARSQDQSEHINLNSIDTQFNIERFWKLVLRDFTKESPKLYDKRRKKSARYIREDMQVC